MGETAQQLRGPQLHQGEAERGGTVVTPALIGTLALLSAVAPLGTDLYLSAFPGMTADLSTSATGVQLTLTAFLVGAGAGQLVFGPLSDRLGRRGPLLLGLLVFLATSVGAVIAPNVELLVAARFLQGLSGAAGMVIARAVIADTSRGAAAARVLSLMMLVGGIAPIAGPFLGSLLAPVIGWRGLLAIVAALGLVSLPLAWLFVRETNPPAVRAARAQVRRDGEVTGRLLSRAYLGNAVAYAFAFATMMAYISASPFLYQTMIGLGQVEYGLAFAANALALAIVGAVNARLVGRFDAALLTRIGLTVNLLAIVAIVVIAFSGLPPVWLAAPILLAVAPLGLILGNTTALALDAAPGRGGSASAWLGALQFVLAGVVASLVGLGGETTAIPLALTMLAASLIAVAGFLVAGGRRQVALG